MDNKEAIARIKNVIKMMHSPRANLPYCQEELEALDLAIKALSERSQGEWIKVKEERMSIEMSGEIATRYKCSNCGRTITILPSKLADYPFCHCGAAMSSDAAMSTNTFSHKCYTISRNKTTCDVCGAILEGNKE